MGTCLLITISLVTREEVPGKLVTPAHLFNVISSQGHSAKGAIRNPRISHSSRRSLFRGKGEGSSRAGGVLSFGREGLMTEQPYKHLVSDRTTAKRIGK